MSKSKIEVVSKDSQGKDITVYVVRPKTKENSAAQKVANITFSEAVENNALFRSQLGDYMRKKGLWDDTKEAELNGVDKEIEEQINKIKSGGIKLSEAKEAAIKARQLRFKKAILLSERTKLDEYTVEGQVENARFNTLVSVCTLDKEGKPVFADLDDYNLKADEPYAVKAASALANMLYDVDQNWEETLPENQFLKKYKFVNDKLQLVNKDGQRITTDGRTIDDDGYYINAEGKRENEAGQLLDENGYPIVEFKPFLDDDGNPVE